MGPHRDKPAEARRVDLDRCRLVGVRVDGALRDVSRVPDYPLPCVLAGDFSVTIDDPERARRLLAALTARHIAGE